MKFKRSSIRGRKAQSLLEYAVLLAVIILALMIMQIYIKRGYQGNIKLQADQVGPQYSPSHTTGVITTNSTTISETYTGGQTDPAGLLVFVTDEVIGLNPQ